MHIKLKSVEQQAIVVTGASSGIGLAVAETAARRGAKVVLAARSGRTLDQIVNRLRGEGHDSVAVVCDVSDREQVDRVVDEALAHFGRIDTWINNAGLGMYGLLEQTDDADGHRLFEINFWGVVNGSLAALPQLRKQGGALINVGSEVSEASTPLLGIYTATKHAVKGFTDSLRIEVEQVQEAPVAVTLIQPTAVNTLFPQHARNYMDTEPKLPKPMLDPQQVADAILRAAERPTLSKKVGGMSVLNTAMFKFAPGIGEHLAAKRIGDLHRQEPPHHPEGALNCSSEAIDAAGQREPAGVA